MTSLGGEDKYDKQELLNDEKVSFYLFFFCIVTSSVTDILLHTHAHSYNNNRVLAYSPEPHHLFRKLSTWKVAPSCATRPFRLALIPHYFYIFHFITKHNISENKSRAF